MVKRKWKKKAAAIVMAAAMAVTAMPGTTIPVYGAENEEQSATGLQNGSFENYSQYAGSIGEARPEKWTYEGTEGAVWDKWEYAKDGSAFLSFWKDSEFTSDLQQEITGLAAGTYSFTVYIQYGGNAEGKECYVYGNGTNQEKRKTNVTTSNSWIEVTISGIQVAEDGKAVVGIYLDGAAGAWLSMDEASMQKQAEVTSGVTNFSFEDNLDSWTVSGTSDVAVSSEDDNAQHGSHVLSIKSNTEYTVDVQQNVTGLEPGWYYLTAYAIKGNGGSEDQKNCYLYANGTAQSPCMTAIPRRGVVANANEWTLITVRGIYVGDNGQVVLGCHTEANANNWLKLDNVQLIKETNQESQYRLWQGGDLSGVTYVEDEGGRYFDEDGKEGDVFQILSDAGFNIARLRLYVAPGKGTGENGYYCKEGYEDLQDILSLARRAKTKDMKIQLSIHYSDYWSNGGTQIIPSEWKKAIEGKSTEEAVAYLENKMYTYTKEVLQAMKAQGTTPEFVSLGNEMQGGLLYPYGKASAENWKYFARFLNSAAKAVREETPNAKIILHSDGAGDIYKYTEFCGGLRDNNVDYDIIGISYYPFWTNMEVSQIVTFCNDLIDEYNKDVVWMETGFNWDDNMPSGQPGQLYHNGPYPYGGENGGNSSPANQREFMYEVLNGIKSVKDGRCYADLYWDPVFVEQEGVGWAMMEETDEADVNAVSNTTLFDFEHKLLPVADAYRYNKEGTIDGTVPVSGKLVGEDNDPVANVTGTLSIGDKDYTVKTDNHGTFHLEHVVSGNGIVQMTVDGMTSLSSDNMVFKMKGAACSGSVKDESGNDVEGRVTLTDAKGNTWSKQTNKDGSYTFNNLPEGEYTVTLASVYMDDAMSETKTLSIGSITTCDFTIAKTKGNIKGKVIDENKNPISGVVVQASDGKCQTKTRYVMRECLPRFVRFAKNVMGVTETGTDEEIAEAGIRGMEEFYHEIGMPTNMKELGIAPADRQIEEMARRCMEASGEQIGSAKKLSQEDMVQIYKNAR